MANSMNLSLIIKADGTSALQTMNQVSDGFDRLDREANRLSGGGLANLTSQLKSLALTAAAGFGLAEIASKFMEVNISTDTLRASLQTVMGSAEDAGLAFRVLQDFAANTPTTIDEVVNSFIMLKSAGLDPSIEALTSYGNTAGATGNKLVEMASAVKDAVMGEYEELKKFNIDMAKNGDNVSITFQGITTTVKNSAAEIQKSLLEIGNVQFAGGMKLQAETLGGVLSTLGDSWDSLWRRMGDAGIKQAAITVIKDLTSWLDTLGPSMTKAGNDASLLDSALSLLGNTIVTVYRELKSGEWGTTTTAIVGLTGAIGGAVAIYASLEVAIVAAATAQGLFNAAVRTNPYTAAVVAIGAMAGALYVLRDETISIGDTTATVGTHIETVWNNTSQTAEAVWRAFIDWIGPAFTGIGTVVTQTGSFILEAWSNTMNAITGVTRTAINIIGSLFNTVGTFIGAVAGEIAIAAETGQANWERFSNFLKTSNAGEYIDVVGDAANRAKSQLDTLANGYKATAENLNWLNQQNRDYAELERGLAADQDRASAATEREAFKQKLLTDQKKRATNAQEQATTALQKGTEEINKLLGTIDKQFDKEQKIANLKNLLKQQTDAYTASNGKLGKSQDEANAILAKYNKGLEANSAGYKAAASSAKQFDKDFASVVKQFLPARDDADKMAKATAVLDKAMADNKITASEYAKAIENVKETYGQATNEAQKLIDKYDRDGAATRELANDKENLNRIIAEGGPEGEKAMKALANLTKQEQEAAQEAAKAAGGFAAAWVEMANGLDDTFKNLWRGLITGQKDVLKNLKERIMEWIADLSYQLLMKPLVVGIQTTLLGGTGTSVAGTAASAVGGTSSLSSGLSSIGNMVSSIFSGSVFSGIATGFSLAIENIGVAGYFGAMGTNLALAGSSASAGAIGTAIGAAAPYLLPVIAIAAPIISKYFSDQEPRVGSYIAQTGNQTYQLEDNNSGAYARGGFGLVFGLNGAGTKNVKASDYQEAFDAMADVSTSIADFFGTKMEDKIKDEINNITGSEYPWLFLTQDEEDVGSAIKRMIEVIGTAAANTGEDVGYVFNQMLTDLTSDTDQLEDQINAIYTATSLANSLTDNWSGELGKMFGLTGNLKSDMDILLNLSKLVKDSGEYSAEAITKLIKQMNVLDIAAWTTGQHLEGISTEKLVKVSDALAEAFGGADAASTAISNYVNNFMTSGERALRTVRVSMDELINNFADLNTDLGLNIEFPDTREEFNALINGIDITTESGLKLYAALMELAPSFDSLYDAVESFKSWIDPLATTEASIEKLKETFKSMGLEMPATYEAFQQLYQSGVLTAGQMAVLANIMDDLGVYDTIASFQNWVDPSIETTKSLKKVQEAFANLGLEMPATYEALQELYQSGKLTAEQMATLGSILEDLDVYQVISNFQNWINPSRELGNSFASIQEAFGKMGLAMPANYEALQQLYFSGQLSAEQMTILGSILGDLDAVFVQSGYDANKLGDQFKSLSGVFAATMLSIQATIEGTRGNIADFDLKPKDLYARYMAEAQSLFDSLGKLESPEQVEEVTKQINDLISSAWGVLSDSEKKSSKDMFLNYLDDLEKAAGERLKALQDTGGGESADLFKTSVSSFSLSSTNFTEAVNSFTAAATSIDKLTTQIQAQQNAYSQITKSLEAYTTTKLPDTSVYQEVLDALQSAAADLREAAKLYQAAGGDMGTAAKSLAASSETIHSAAKAMPAEIRVTVDCTAGDGEAEF